jgi:hypothetical protein
MQKAWKLWGVGNCRTGKANLACRTVRTSSVPAGSSLNCACVAIVFSARGHFRSVCMSGPTENATYSLKWTGRVVMHLNEVLHQQTRNYKRTPQLHLMDGVSAMKMNTNICKALYTMSRRLQKSKILLLLRTTHEIKLKLISILTEIKHKHIWRMSSSGI